MAPRDTTVGSRPKSGVRRPDEVAFLGFRFRCMGKEEGDVVAVFPSKKAEQRLKAARRS